ncbi:hypothetical protein PR202_ga15450 [Eleusine coracana subsp. coracana]|uniref:PRELI/MSF1 domain-containing protein n=1 Tax=Eleusine coracana subsp. coracana TaxID=191504 RepID=A0AAV5CKE2_ELECO|nr:hypothetical protein PR202_ga15450 [Eleusine coracana subsp. coracana]
MRIYSSSPVLRHTSRRYVSSRSSLRLRSSHQLPSRSRLSRRFSTPARGQSIMVISYTQEHVYRHPWHRVTAAAWRKFTDPAARAAPLSHILDVQTLSRDVDARSGRLRAVRAIAGRAPPLPFLLRRLLSAGDAVVVLCVERTDVDGAARDMRVVSRNANLRGIVDVEERCSYAPHPERPDEWTLFRQETSIRCAPLAAVAARVAEMVERRCAERFAQNAASGRDVVERICEDLAELDSLRQR